MNTFLSLFVIVLFSYEVSAKSKHNCTTPKPTKYYLYEVFTAADVVVTGTIKSVVLNERNHRVTEAQVKVKRIFKGREYLSDPPKTIKVRGIAETQPCAHRLKLGSTRIFALSSTENSFYLNVPVVRLNLHTLDALHYTSLNRAHKKRRKTKHLHCETFLCGFGEKCNYKTGQCECRTSCKSEFGSPVCGSDNVTYQSLCHLSIRACILNREAGLHPGLPLRPVSRTACQKRNPCDDLRCGPGEDCVVTQEKGLLSAKCTCPESCPNYGDSVDSSPVCSTAGIDYPSLCHLKKQACESKTNITLKYHGKCDPCEGKVCPFGLSCIVDTNRKASCRCSQQCPLSYEPVCGTDGRTYTNNCLLKTTACRESRDVDVYSQGPCDEKKNPCSAKKCKSNSECHILSDHKAECRCREKCPQIVKPVCGTDGVTYESECEMERTACRTNATISVKHNGACGSGLCAADDACLAPKVCAIIDGKKKCVCPLCDHELKEVCASDGRTYQSECRMKQTACAESKELFVKYRGVCEGCESRKCEFYSSCIADGLHSPKCQCPECPNWMKSEDEEEIFERKPVCGTDGVTYSSECHLRKSSCQQNKFIVVAFEGKCDACQNVDCKYGEECRGGQCVCSFHCPSKPAESERVCGEDGVFYASQCHSELAACQKGSPIALVSMEQCSSNQATFQDSCQCNKLGAYGPTCDNKGQCKCRPGVGGKKCDACLPGFWGLHLLARGAVSCTPCGCSAFGSARSDCDQTTGRCECRPNVLGQKCNKCPDDLAFGEDGCTNPVEYKAPSNCINMRCHHGAKCIVSSGHPMCVCPKHMGFREWEIAANMSICGSDGVLYDNIHHLQSTACKHQTDTVPVALGSCDQEEMQIADRLERNEDHIERKLGSSCRRNSQCRKLNAICRNSPGRRGVCECEEGKKSLKGVCITSEQQSSVILNVPLNRQSEVYTELGGITTMSSFTVKYSSNQQDYVILYGRGERGEEFRLSARNGQIEIRIGNSTLESMDRVRGFVEIQLTWDGHNLNLNVNGEERRKKMFVKGEKIETLHIGSDRKISGDQLIGDLEELEIDSQKVRYRDLMIKDSPPAHLRVIGFPGSGGFLKFDNFSGDVRTVAQITVTFKSRKEEGLLFYWGSTSVASGDFVSIVLENSKPQVSWNLGTGVTTLTGPSIIEKEWNTVQFSLVGRNGTLKVNKEPSVSEEATPGGIHLDINSESVYVGGVNSESILPSKVKQFVGDNFDGNLALVVINETPLDLDQVKSYGDVKWADNEDCDNCDQGFCVRDFEQSICRQEGTAHSSAAYFDGHEEYAYLNTGNRTTPSSNTSDFSFEFRTNSQSGTLWHESSWSLKESGDFLVIFIHEGVLHIGLNLGNDLDLKAVSSNVTVDDEEWHKVEIRRRDRTCQLSVDGRRVLRIVTTPGSTQLNTNGVVYIGGRQESALPLQNPYIGCIRKVKIRGVHLSLLHDAISLKHPASCSL